MRVVWLLAGIVLGVVAFGVVRLLAVPWPEPTHYHANWQVIIDGERLDLSAARYMEDVTACTAGDQITPAQRVHMHNGEDGIVHVHDEGVAWGHFLENLGFDAGRDYLILDDGRQFSEQDGRSVTYVVNGFVADDIRGRLIRSGDRLLISYGVLSAADVLAQQYPRVPDNAEEYNTRQDPAGCAGAAELSFGDRLRRAFWH